MIAPSGQAQDHISHRDLIAVEAGVEALIQDVAAADLPEGSLDHVRHERVAFGSPASGSAPG